MKNKALRISLCFIFTVTILISLFFLSLNSCHNHKNTHESSECPICTMIESVRHNLSTISGETIIAILGIIISFYMILSVFSPDVISFKTPVMLSVRLDN